MRVKNVFSGIKARASREISRKILRSTHVKIEKIFSRGQKSPEGFWYDQKSNEWVLLLKGAARLKFEGRRNLVRLKAGDYVNIPKHTAAAHFYLWPPMSQKGLGPPLR